MFSPKHVNLLINCLSLLCRKPFTIQSTICLGESRGWSRGNSYYFNAHVYACIWMFIFIQKNADHFLSALLSFFVCWCNWHFYRKQPCLMPGMKYCQFCTWWQCYYCHRLIYYFFPEHPLIVISQKYQKVSNKIIQHMSTYSLYNLLHNLILHPTTKIHLIKIIPIGDTSQLILFLLCVYVILWFHGLCCL